jgi:hypothetical protein
MEPAGWMVRRRGSQVDGHFSAKPTLKWASHTVPLSLSVCLSVCPTKLSYRPLQPPGFCTRSRDVLTTACAQARGRRSPLFGPLGVGAPAPKLQTRFLPPRLPPRTRHHVLVLRSR